METFDMIKDIQWKQTEICDGEDHLFTAYLPDGGRLTVLDRLTGYGDGRRDIETGYKDKDGNFWLASGDCDVRERYDLTIEQAVDWIKQNANTRVPNRGSNDGE